MSDFRTTFREAVATMALSMLIGSVLAALLIATVVVFLVLLIDPAAK